MVLEMKICADTVNRVERFLVTDSYRALAESTMSFNRKLNEERKMRIPYIDGQTGVAQKHYNSERKRRERMPGRRPGQLCSYPQKTWRKKRYQYLQYFMQPKHLRVEPEGMNPEQKVGSEVVNKDETNQERAEGDKGETEWSNYYEDDFALQEPEEDKAEESDSDYEFDGTRIKKVKGRKNAKTKTIKATPAPPKIKEVSGVKPPQPNKRRTHADNIPDSEKPFTCDLCSARYKTRPGLTYHFNHTHRKSSQEPEYTPSILQPEEEETRSSGSPVSAVSVAGSDSQDNMTGSGLAGSSLVKMKTPELISSTQPEEEMSTPKGKPSSFTKLEKAKQKTSPAPIPVSNTNSDKRTSSGAPIAPPALYCDFCLGDSKMNKKTMLPEELIGCAECGRSGHPTCLQFTGNMLISVKQYPWQCIECKTCTICGTSENDDQLLFCDDCDRGFHMYCLNPPMKVAPEGTWSCHICNEIFHN